MQHRNAIRRLLHAVAVLLLLVLSWGALTGGVQQLPRSESLAQRTETGAQLLAGALSLLVILTTRRLRSWCRPVRLAWGASLVVAAGLSPLVWGPPMPWLAALAAAVAGAFALLLNRMLR